VLALDARALEVRASAPATLFTDRLIDGNAECNPDSHAQSDILQSGPQGNSNRDARADARRFLYLHVWLRAVANRGERMEGGKMLKLYTYFRSSAAFRVRIALNLKGLDWQPEVVWLTKDEHRGDEYRALNPQALVPTLVDGETVLNQSLAIIEYLDETRPERPLLPAEPAARARVRSLSLLVASEIHPLNNLRVLRHLEHGLGLDQERIGDWYRHWCDEGLAAFERQLADGRAGRYCHGDTVTMADVCLVPQIFNARRFRTQVERYPRTMEIFDACMKLEAFRRAEPSAQAEAPKSS
jgi:maleylacetoacetate isomerase